MSAPLVFLWDGEAMAPLPRFARAADQQFVIGEHYTLEEVQERSSATHRHYFAAVHEAWANLPEAIADRFPTSEHLRKVALIRTGYRDERSVVCGSKAEAQRVAAFIKPIDDYAVVTVSEAVVTIFTAKSQSTKAMGRVTFQDSKERVLAFLAELLGVERGSLPTQRAA